MTDFISKVISIVIVFLMLIVGPMTISYSQSLMESKRQILNDTELFLDKITDKKSITDTDLNDFYMAINSHGMVLDATVKKIRVAQTADQPNEVIYIGVSSNPGVNEIDQLGTQEIVQVLVREVTQSKAKRMIYQVLKIDEGNYHLELAKMVS